MIGEKAEEILKPMINKIVDFIYQKIKKATAFHGKRSLIHLVKKYPNQGIHTENDLKKKDIDTIKKELNKMKIDYAITESEKGYSLTVVGGCKSVVEKIMNDNDIKLATDIETQQEVQSKSKKPKQEKESFLKQQIKEYKEKAKEVNSQRQAPAKHRDIGAR